ncbi:MAG: HDOD domain-containing protein [Desulfobacterales bacterium]
MSPNVKTDTIRDRVDRLPLVDIAVFEIMEVLNDPNSTYDQITERLSPDITARFLNLANSAYCGMDVRSIGHAVKLLGYNAMRQNLITSFLIEHFTRHLELGYFDFDTFHAHSQLTGLIAKALGDMIDYRHSGDLYTAAILHNLGELVLAVYFEDAYRRIADSGPMDFNGRLTAERDIIGTGRREIRAMVLERFNIPDAICKAVRHIDAVDRSLGDADDFELELTLRKAIEIAGSFEPPSEADLHLLGQRLKQLLPECRQRYREGVSAELQKGGYQKAFPGLLESVSATVSVAAAGVLSPAEAR